MGQTNTRFICELTIFAVSLQKDCTHGRAKVPGCLVQQKKIEDNKKQII